MSCIDLDKARAEAKRAGLVLERADGRLALTDGTMILVADFGHLQRRIAAPNLGRELLVRAAKMKRVPDGKALQAADATAGLGEDSFLLAAAGFRVVLFERNPVIAAMLEDALGRAAGQPGLAEIAARMSLVNRDSVEALGQLGFSPDLVLLDPMFPAKQKSSAVKKKLQLLQCLEQPCTDEGALFDAARAVSPRKIVVKRPAHGPHLAGRKPSYALAGKAVRFDCYV